MKQTVLMMMVLSGLCFLPACFPHFYRLVKSEMNWTQAQDYCRKKHIDLASVDNEQDLARLSEVLQGVTFVWIGLQADTEAWRWSLEHQDSYGERKAEFRMWNNGEPNDGPGTYKSCVAMVKNGNWADQLCGNTFPFFCYNNSTSSFIYVNVNKSWDDAQSYCREHHTDLASVRNQSENEQLMMMWTSCTWIGLYRNTWKWSDGSPHSFINWVPNAPSTVLTASCAHFSGMWINSDCKYQRYFVCNTFIKRRKVLKVELKKTDTSVDIEQLKEEILERFGQKLKEHNLSGDISLRWVKQPDGKIFHKDDKKEDEESCAIK